MLQREGQQLALKCRLFPPCSSLIKIVSWLLFSPGIYCIHSFIHSPAFSFIFLLHVFNFVEYYLMICPSARQREDEVSKMLLCLPGAHRVAARLASRKPDRYHVTGMACPNALNPQSEESLRGRLIRLHRVTFE